MILLQSIPTFTDGLADQALSALDQLNLKTHLWLQVLSSVHTKTALSTTKNASCWKTPQERINFKTYITCFDVDDENEAFWKRKPHNGRALVLHRVFCVSVAEGALYWEQRKRFENDAENINIKCIYKKKCFFPFIRISVYKTSN